MARVFDAESLRYQLLDQLPNKLQPRVAKELLGLGVDEDDGSLAVHDHDRIWSRLQKPTELVLGTLPLGDVADRARDQRALFGFEGAQADFDRELRPVFALAVELQTRAHRPC